MVWSPRNCLEDEPALLLQTSRLVHGTFGLLGVVMHGTLGLREDSSGRDSIKTTPATIDLLLPLLPLLETLASTH
jgi:hypothetical protein